PGHVEGVAAELRARPARGQVGAGVRLREALAPHLLASQDATQEAALLRLGAVLDEGRADQRRPHADVDQAGGADARVLLGEEELLDRRGAAAAVLARPVEPGPAPLVQLPLPPARKAHLLRRLLGLAIVGRTPPRGQVRDQPLMHLALEAPLGGVQAEIHRISVLDEGAGAGQAPRGASAGAGVLRARPPQAPRAPAAGGGTPRPTPRACAEDRERAGHPRPRATITSRTATASGSRRTPDRAAPADRSADPTPARSCPPRWRGPA